MRRVLAPLVAALMLGAAPAWAGTVILLPGGAVSASNPLPVAGAITQSGTWTVEPGNTANTTPWLMALPDLEGALGAASAPSKGVPVLGQYEATLPTLAAGQTAALQTDSSARLLISPSGLTNSQGSTTSGETGDLVFGAATTAAPSYTAGNSYPLSLDTSGNLRINCVTGCGGSGGTASSFGAAFPTTGTAAGLEYLSALPTLTSGDMAAFQGDSSGRLLVDGSGVTQPVSGTVTANQGGAPWSNNVTQWDSTALGAPTAYGTAPTGNVPGVNAYVTNAPTVNQGGAPWTVNPGTAANWGIGATGSAVPANAQYAGAVSSGNLTGIIQADTSVPINVATAATTQLVALAAGKKIYVTHYDFVAAAAESVTFEYGTGTNCGTGTTALTGAYPAVANGGLSAGGGLGPVLIVPAGNALCVVTSAAAQLSGAVSYTQF